MRRRRRWLQALPLALVLLQACSGSMPAASPHIDDAGLPAVDTSSAQGSVREHRDGPEELPEPNDAASVTEPCPCALGEVCVENECVPSGECGQHDDCLSDLCCSDRSCVPWGQEPCGDFDQWCGGAPGPTPAGSLPDLTADDAQLIDPRSSCYLGAYMLCASVANRGAAATGGPFALGLYWDDNLICRFDYVDPLLPGQQSVGCCKWDGAPVCPLVDVQAIADVDDTVTECRQGNNVHWLRDLGCGTNCS